MQENDTPRFGSFPTDQKANTISKDTHKARRKRHRHDSRSHSNHAEPGGSTHPRRRLTSGYESPAPRSGDHLENRADAPILREPNRANYRDSNSNEGSGRFSPDFDQWIIDQRGDELNVAYDSLHKYSVPAYYRGGAGRVLGMSREFVFEQSQHSERGLLLESPKKDRPSTGSMFSRTAPSKHEKSLKYSPPQSGPEALRDLQLDFLPLRESKRQKLHHSFGTSGSDDDQALYSAYRSFRDSAEKYQVSGTDGEEERDGQEDEKSVASRRRNGELMKTARSNPNNAAGWFAVIAYQAEYLFPGRDHTALNLNEQRALDDARLDLYKTALKATSTSSPDYETLLLSSLQLHTQILEASAAQQKWLEALSSHGTSYGLLLAYVGFMQTRPEPDFQQTVDSYLKVFGHLQHMKQEDEDFIKTQQVYVFLKYTSFLRDAGHDEAALSLWQVLLDLNSMQILPNDQDILDKLKVWWEQDTPRIGEEKGSSFSEWSQQIGPAPPGRAHAERQENGVDHQNIAQLAWIERESTLQQSLHLPAALDEDVEDPYCHIMWTDLQPIVSKMLRPLPKDLLINAWLLFMDLPAISHCNSRGVGPPQEWQADPFLSPQSLYSGIIEFNATHMNELRIVSMIETSVGHYGRQCASRFNQYRPASPLCQSAVRARYVQRTLNFMCKHLTWESEFTERIGEYLIAFVHHVYPTEVGALAKRLIKAAPRSIILYNAYALATFHTDGGQETARQIWTAALSMEANLDLKGAIWRDWTMSELVGGNVQLTLAVFTRMANGNSAAAHISAAISSGQQLRIDRFLRHSLSCCIDESWTNGIVAFAEMLAVFVYLTSNREIDAYLETLRICADRVATSKDKSILVELLLQSQADHLERHIQSSRRFKFSTLINCAAESIKLFPRNSKLLSVYNVISSMDRTSIRLRLKPGLWAPLEETRGDVIWSSAVEEEIRRWISEPPSATAESVRALFRRALLNPRSESRQCAHLWMIWLSFELVDAKRTARSGSIPTQKLASVYFEGIRAVPLNKRWAVSAMHKLRREGVLDDAEVKTMKEDMERAGLRFRVD